jgi:DNA polymerase-3 subunit delta
MSQSKSKSIFCWYGENDFDMQETIQHWVSAFEKKYTGLNVVRHDVADTTLSKIELIQSVKNALQVESLFGSNKLVILKNFLTPAGEKNEELMALLQKAVESVSDNFFLIMWQTKKPDSRRKMFKGLQKLEKSGQAEVKEFVLPQGNALYQWIDKRVATHKATIDPRARDMLLAFVGNNLWQLDAEIAKLSSYCGGAPITLESVQKLVKARFNDDIFALMDALSQRDKRTVLHLMRDQLESGASEMYLLAMLVRQFRLLRQVKDFVSNKGVRDNYAIAKALKVHPFVIKKLLPQVGKFSQDQLKTIYAQLIEIEFALKSRSTSFSVLFDTFVVTL